MTKLHLINKTVLQYSFFNKVCWIYIHENTKENWERKCLLGLRIELGGERLKVQSLV